MKAVLVTLSAMVLAVAVGCDDKKPKGVEVNTPNAEVKTGDKADGGGVQVNAPGVNVEVKKEGEPK